MVTLCAHHWGTDKMTSQVKSSMETETTDDVQMICVLFLSCLHLHFYVIFSTFTDGFKSFSNSFLNPLSLLQPSPLIYLFLCFMFSTFFIIIQDMFGSAAACWIFSFWIFSQWFNFLSNFSEPFYSARVLHLLLDLFHLDVFILHFIFWIFYIFWNLFIRFLPACSNSNAPKTLVLGMKPQKL